MHRGAVQADCSRALRLRAACTRRAHPGFRRAGSRHVVGSFLYVPHTTRSTSPPMFQVTTRANYARACGGEIPHRDWLLKGFPRSAARVARSVASALARATPRPKEIRCSFVGREDALVILELMMVRAGLYWMMAAVFLHAAPVLSAEVGHWSFEEGAGFFAADTSGSGNTGTLSDGPLWIPGEVGGALDFDHNRVLVADHASLDIAGPITLAAWIRPDRRATQYLVKKAKYSSTDGYELSLSSRLFTTFDLDQIIRARSR